MHGQLCCLYLLPTSERALPMWFLTRIPLLSLHIFSWNWAPESLHPSITGLGNKICWILYSQSKKTLPIAYLSIWVVTLNAFWVGVSVRHLCFCAFFSGPLLVHQHSSPISSALFPSTEWAHETVTGRGLSYIFRTLSSIPFFPDKSRYHRTFTLSRLFRTCQAPGLAAGVDPIAHLGHFRGHIASYMHVLANKLENSCHRWMSLQSLRFWNF